MKKISFALMLISSLAGAQCPIAGSSRSAKLQHLDSLKNRSNFAQATIVDINNFFTQGEDTFSVSMCVQITGYVKLVKYGGPESCNCKSKDKADWDYHIELIPALDYAGLPMICEVNRYVRCVTYEQLKAMVGQRVIICGWVFKDVEHKQNAALGNPKGTDLWRETIDEIHPCIKIQLAN